jgi:M6 family metalloprotease-like protein
MKRRLRLLTVVLPLLLLVGVIGWELSRERKGTGVTELTRVTALSEKQAPAVVDDGKAETAFRAWWGRFQVVDAEKRAAMLPEGRAVLAQRRGRMARLIREDPEQALKESLKLHEYENLPQELRGMVEKPFSAAAAYEYYPVCGAPAGMADHIAALNLEDGRFEAFTFGRRAGVMSKNSIPVQGITLDGAAAMHDLPLRRLDAAEVATAQRLFPMGQKDATKSFLSGEPLAVAPVVALGGGRLYLFSNEAEFTQLNQALAKLDDLPGPNAGSDVLYQAMAADGSSGGFDLSGAQASEQMQADAWTENPKNVFLIRADFSDLAGLTYSQATTANVMNGVVSDQIRAMSYGKTWIIAGVSQNLYRMPQTSAYYVNGGDSRNSELLRDARNTFRNTRSGGDAAINIGPVSNNTNGDGSGLGSYDIVGVLFGSMGMVSGGVTYAGLAGGGNLWMQGSISDGVFTHEFGHNYGIGHSSFWQTSDGSVFGTGSNVEYGDDYDIMGGGDLPKGHFHAQAKAKLNWLTSSEWSDATAGGSATYRVHRIDSQFTTGTQRGVRITRSAVSGSEEYLWLNYRPLYVGIPFFEKGAYMVWQRPGQTRSWLVDTTPATSGVKSDAPIPLGSTFAEASSNAFITPVALGGSGDNAWLDVRVNFGPFPGNAAPTAGAISGLATVPARTSNLYSVSASDANGDTLAYSWNTGDGSVPGNSSGIAQTWTLGGSYTLNLTVSDMKGGTLPLSKAVTVTDPLDTWTTGSVGSSEYLEQIVYAEGRYVSAEYFGGVFLSWDGVTWSSVADPTDLDQPKLAYGAGVFVAAGIKQSAPTTAQITWSADGRRWNQATFPNGVPYVRAVAFGGGKFTAVGDDGTVLTSADGKTWSVTTIGAMPDLRRIAWSGGAWVAAALHPTGGNAEVIWSSPDAITWTERSSLGFDIYQLVTSAGKVFAIGWYGGVDFSTDHGVTWTAATLPAGTRWSTYLMAVAEDGTLLCTARAMDEPGTSNALLVSIDGQRWVRASGNTSVVNADALAWADGRFITVEDGGVTRRSNSFYPTNAAPNASFTTSPATANARQPVYLAANATDAEGGALTYAWDFGSQADVQDGFEIAPTFSFGGPYNVTLRVSDGRGGVATLNHTITINDPARTFTDHSVSSAVGDLNAVAASSSRVVAVGSRFVTTFKGGWAWSTSGTTWTTGEFGLNEHMYAITHDGTQFLAAGQGSSGGWRGLVKTSPDGVSWTQRYFTGTELYAIAHGGGVYVAAGNDGSVIRSTNGTSWSAVAIPGVTTSVTFGGLSWNGSIFLLTGYTGTNGTTQVFTSTDGLTWVDQSAGAGVASWQDLRKSAWLNDRFVSSGWYSKLRVSTDNGSTFSTTRTDSEETPGLAYGGGVYFAAGVNRSASNADIDLLSLNGTDWFSYAAPTTTDRRAAVFFNNTFITVGDAGSIWQSATLSGASGFAAWQSANYPTGGIPALADRDADNDGLNNFAEYALGFAPTTPNGSMGYAVQQTGRTWLHLDLPQPALADVRYIIQGNTSLTGGTWTEIARKTGTGAWSWSAGGTTQITTGPASGGKVPTEVGVPDSQISQPRYFMRLVIEQL